MKRIAVVIFFAAACGEAGGGELPDAAAPDLDAGAAPAAVGVISVIELGRAFARARFDGQVGGAVRGVHTETAREGPCRLLEAEPAFCDPVCAGTCVAENQCEPFPTALSAGDITLTGLTSDVRLEVDPFGNYSSTPFPLPDDIFGPGDTITANAAGDEIEAFSVPTIGVSDLDAVTGDGRIALRDDADAVFAWTPSGQDGDRVRLLLEVPPKGHGLPLRAIVDCDVDDALGAMTLPREIIARLPPMDGSEDACGNPDCGTRAIRRYRGAMVETSRGLVELVVASQSPLFPTH